MNKKGFTLLELLVVVLIIGILASVALPQYRKAVEKSRIAEMVTFVGNAKKAVSAYLLQYGMPSAWTDLLTTPALDIDLTKGLECPDEVTVCFSKYYYYEIGCGNTRCNIGVYRTKESGQSDPLHYKGGLTTEDGGQTWHESDGHIYDEIGQITCRALNEQGDGTAACAIN